MRCSRERRCASTGGGDRRRHATSTSRKEAPVGSVRVCTPARDRRARISGDYKVWLEFNDGRKGVVDLADELHGEELEPLRNRDRFSEFYLDYGLCIDRLARRPDFTPEFLYDKLKAMN